MSVNPVLEAALTFHAKGICAIPTELDGTKKPLGSWAKWQSERPSPEQLVAWFADGTRTGIGVVCGAISGNLIMLELEGRAAHHLNQIEALAKGSDLERVFEKICSGYWERSPSGGFHWLFKVEGGERIGNLKLAAMPGDDSKALVLAETRGEGGFSIVAPSGGKVHNSGGSWEMIDGSIATIPTITYDEAEGLFSLFRTIDQMPTNEEIRVKRESVSTGHLPGDAFNAQATWEDLLIPLGWRKVYGKESQTFWRRPGKSLGISATTGRNDSDNLFVFSTSTIFPANEPISKFAAYAYIHFHGDMKAASADLRSRGYGNTKPLDSIALEAFAPQFEASGGESEPNWESSWKPVDLAPYFDGTYQAPVATIFQREDGIGLFYPGKVHSIYGESESGKSWVAQMAVAQQLALEKQVVYIDFEADAADVVARLVSLGRTQAEIRQFLTYIRPDAKPYLDDPYWKELLERKNVSLVIIDGVTEALTMWGGETKDNDAITRWIRTFPRAVANGTGGAVVTIDHIAKDRESRGRFAIGGQAKLAAIDGAAYMVEPIEMLAPGKTGRLSVRITKDRHGSVRKASSTWESANRTQEAAVILMDSTREQIRFWVNEPVTDEIKGKLLKDRQIFAILTAIKENPGVTTGVLKTTLSAVNKPIAKKQSARIGSWEGAGSEQGLKDVVAELVASGHIRTEAGEKDSRRHFVTNLPLPAVQEMQNLGQIVDIRSIG